MWGFFFTTPYPGSYLYNLPFVQKLILQKYTTKDGYFSALGDASILYVNMTKMTDSQLAFLREWAKREAWAPQWFPTWAPYFFLWSYSFLERLFRLIREPYRWGTVLRNRIRMLGQFIKYARKSTKVFLYRLKFF